MSPRPKFPQIEYDEASGELRQTYDDIQATLRVPWVMFAARSLAVFGGYVPAAWRAAKPNFSTHYLERAADELRARAVLPVEDPPDPRPALAAQGFDEMRVREVRRALDALNYGNAKYLLLITAWCECIQGRVGGGGSALSGPDAAPLDPGVPEGMARLDLVDPSSAPPRVQRLFDRVTDIHFHHGPSSDFRVLANWPEFLEVAVDDVLGPVVRTEPYEATARALLDGARDRVRRFPSPAGLDPQQAAEVCTDTEIAAITGVLFMFQRFILDVTIDMVRCTQALDGREAAVASPFPVTR